MLVFYLHGMMRRLQLTSKKNRITFKTAATAFLDPNSIYFHDSDHDDNEPRRNIIAMPQSILRVIFVAYVERINLDDQELIRIISARKANGKEKKLYEQNLHR